MKRSRRRGATGVNAAPRGLPRDHTAERMVTRGAPSHVVTLTAPIGRLWLVTPAPVYLGVNRRSVTGNFYPRIRLLSPPRYRSLKYSHENCPLRVAFTRGAFCCCATQNILRFSATLRRYEAHRVAARSFRKSRDSDAPWDWLGWPVVFVAVHHKMKRCTEPPRLFSSWGT